jgi:hypothetical protein
MRRTRRPFRQEVPSSFPANGGRHAELLALQRGLSAPTIRTLLHDQDRGPQWQELRDRTRRGYEKDVLPDDPIRDHSKRWYSKHGVQAVVVAYLIASGWSLQWEGDCLRRDRTHASDLGFIGEPWHDVEADRDGKRLFLEVTPVRSTAPEMDRHFCGLAIRPRGMPTPLPDTQTLSSPVPVSEGAIRTPGLFRHIRHRVSIGHMHRGPTPAATSAPVKLSCGS